MLLTAFALWHIVQSIFTWHRMKKIWDMGQKLLDMENSIQKLEKHNLKVLKKKRQNMQYLRRGHMKINYTQMTMRKMSDQFRLR
ncbi:hypothetical protein CK203_064369 [Vitis vinifera]|uniref:Uncharacterized protein n=1 Tax=Vitis vinifera TaxID=29760 RepID=A0A438FPH8_VITVI|nr:hypothetical protein CK203_064369 [Vitis vinifera]